VVYAALDKESISSLLTFSASNSMWIIGMGSLKHFFILPSNAAPIAKRGNDGLFATFMRYCGQQHQLAPPRRGHAEDGE
jgi:hypothetical protein